MCRSKEAAKKHGSDITRESKVVAALRHPYQPACQASPMCPGCGAAMHKGGRRQCPAYNQVCAYCRKFGHYAKVCRSKQAQPPPHNSENQPSARAIRVQSEQLSQQQHLQLHRVQEAATEPAPTIVSQVTSSTESHHLDVLPDSGADISAAGQKVLEILGQHVDNILPSDINPRTVNGLTPLGRLPVTITLGTKTY